MGLFNITCNNNDEEILENLVTIVVDSDNFHLLNKNWFSKGDAEFKVEKNNNMVSIYFYLFSEKIKFRLDIIYQTHPQPNEIRLHSFDTKSEEYFGRRMNNPDDIMEYINEKIIC